MGIVVGGYYSQDEAPSANIIARVSLRAQAAALSQPDVNALPHARLALRAIVDAEQLATITISGETGINSIDLTAPHVATSGIRVNDDGTIDKITQVNGGSLTYTQIDTSTDWIIPNALASSLYEFKLDVTSNGPNYNSDSTATWIAMGSGSQSSSHLIWMNRRTTSGTTNWTWTLRARKDGGSELDNGVYSGTNDCTPL